MNKLESCSTPNMLGQTENCAKFIIEDPTSPFKLHAILQNDQQYTLSFWSKSDVRSNILVCGSTLPTTDEWNKHIVHFIGHSNDMEIYFQSTGIYYISRIKLEKGNKATEWDMSIDDISDAIDIEISDLRNEIVDEQTSILENAKEITLEALGSYVQRNTGTYVVNILHYYAIINDKSSPSDDTIWTDTNVLHTEYDDNYVWCYETIIYSDGFETDTEPISIFSTSNKRTIAISPQYAINDDRTEPILRRYEYDDTGQLISLEEGPLEWDINVPAVNNSYKYIWTRYAITEYETGYFIYETDERLIAEYKVSFTELEQQLKTSLSVSNDSINMRFDRTTSRIDDLEKTQNDTNITKYIEYSENGIIIRSGVNELELQLDNEKGIIFSKNGETFGTWDGTDFHTGNIIIDVEHKAQFGNYAFVPRSDGSLMFLKVGE